MHQNVDEMLGKLKEETEAFRNTRHHCGDCGVLEGELHQPGCDMERCFSCGGQRISCGCEHHENEQRVPFILYPTLCRRCGQIFPDLFKVPDEEWNRYVEVRQRRGVLCFDCFSQIRRWIDGTETQDTREEFRERMKKYVAGES